MAGEEVPREVQEECFQLCKDFLGSPWTKIAISQLRISPVSGGISNTIYRCSLPSDVIVKDTKTPRQVLVRFYGPVQEDEHTKVTETSTFVILSEKGLGPKLYGVFPKGRIEEYIPSRHLSSNDNRRFGTSIARSMAKYHALNLPLKKAPDSWLYYLSKWFKDMENDAENFPLLNMYKEEINFLKKEIENYDSPSVFCHNDLVQGNILLPDDCADDSEPNLVIIDFEFGGYNYRSHDIANHLCEWAFDYDVKEPPYFTFDANKLPTKEEKIKFIRAYLNQMVLENVFTFSEIDAEEEKILKELEFFNMVTQIIWAVWSEKNKFDTKLGIFHVENLKSRMSNYWSFKKCYLSGKTSQ